MFWTPAWVFSAVARFQRKMPWNFAQWATLSTGTLVSPMMIGRL
jgi:hypothetical protein